MITNPSSQIYNRGALSSQYKIPTITDPSNYSIVKKTDHITFGPTLSAGNPRYFVLAETINPFRIEPGTHTYTVTLLNAPVYNYGNYECAASFALVTAKGNTGQADRFADTSGRIELFTDFVEDIGGSIVTNSAASGGIDPSTPSRIRQYLYADGKETTITSTITTNVIVPSAYLLVLIGMHEALLTDTRIVSINFTAI